MLLLYILSYFKHKTHYYLSPKWYHSQPLVKDELYQMILQSLPDIIPTLYYLLINCAANSRKSATFLKLSNC